MGFVMFNPPKKQLDHELKIKCNSKKLYQIDSVRNLEIHIDKVLNSKSHTNNVAINLNKGNA